MGITSALAASFDAVSAQPQFEGEYGLAAGATGAPTPNHVSGAIQTKNTARPAKAPAALL